MKGVEKQIIAIQRSSDVIVARRKAKELAGSLGFDEKSCEEIMLSVSELAGNIVKYAGQGVLKVMPLIGIDRRGIQVEAQDNGPGIANPQEVMTDGFSTGGTLGSGLGSVNRLMGECEILSLPQGKKGTHIICRRWLPLPKRVFSKSPLAFGAACRPLPGSSVNGDAFVIKKMGHKTLIAIIDGVGHGPQAHKASQAARIYIENHYDLPIADIFKGVEIACQATRGVVMSIASIDCSRWTLIYGGVGNIESRVFGTPEKYDFIVRRGIVGKRSPKPLISERPWSPKYSLVLHTDGLMSRWKEEEFFALASPTKPASDIALEMLRKWGKEEDDATVIVVKEDLG